MLQYEFCIRKLIHEIDTFEVKNMTLKNWKQKVDLENSVLNTYSIFFTLPSTSTLFVFEFLDAIYY